MSDSLLRPIKVTASKSKYRVLTPELWLVQPPAGGNSVLHLHSETDSTIIHQSSSFLLLLSNEVCVSLKTKTLTLSRVKFEMLSKCLAFIDEARDLAIFGDPLPQWSVIPVEDTNIWQDSERCKSWFLTHIVDDAPELAPLLNLLRNNENYRLVRYLLAQSAENRSMHEMGERYGISSSHFRRLCRNALGDSGKTELCNWRMARALLDIIDGEKNLTEVAFSYGYSSLAHFSNDVKKRLTISPQQLFSSAHPDTSE